MPKFIALLRAINVGGHNVKMEELRLHFVAMGFSNVETFIASGNVISESSAKNTSSLQTKIEAHLLKALGYEVATFIRTPAEIASIAAYKPFKEAAMKSAGALNVAFLAEPLSADGIKTLMQLKSAIDDFHVHDREVYLLCKMRQSDSKFSNAVFEKATKVKATFRGINTIAKLAAKYPVS